MPTLTRTCPAVVDRHQLVAALQSCQRVAPRRCVKPILRCVRLEARGATLRLAATDGETTLVKQLPARGPLPATVVFAADLLARVRAAAGPTCALMFDSTARRLEVRGAAVSHKLPAGDPADFPPVPSPSSGPATLVEAPALLDGLRIVRPAIARAPSRYAIGGVLLEMQLDGLRLVATDGRRLVVHELDGTCPREMQVILPAGLLRVLEKLALRQEGPLTVRIVRAGAENRAPSPGRIFVHGVDWFATTSEPDGCFPVYRDVIPRSASLFRIDRAALLSALREVALATSDDARAVRIDLLPDQVRLSARSADNGASSATVPASFLGGGDREIHTGFNPAYLLDALKSLDSADVVVDVAQNGCGTTGTVFGQAALLYAYGRLSTRWVIMPVSLGLPVTRENLGSNYHEDAA